MTVTVGLIRSLMVVGSLLGAIASAAAQDAGGRVVGPSGLPLPRFASLAAPEVNVRTGPSTDHPIRWVYSRAGLPVRIVEEFDVWRRIEDPDGEQGWTHSSLLSIRKTVMIRGDGIQDLRRSPDPTSRVVLRAEPGVIGQLTECEGEWCRVEIAGQRGWLQRDRLWGAPEAD